MHKMHRHIRTKLPNFEKGTVININMNRKFDCLMFKEIKIKNLCLRVVDIFFMLCIMALGFLIRFSMRRIESGDWTGSFTAWMNFITENGGFRALAMDNFDYEYNCIYMYIMCIISYIKSPFTAMYWLKLVSVIFDYIAAFTVFHIIYHITASRRSSILGFAVVLLLPTIAINSGAWTQCDSIYTTFLLLSFYFILKDKSLPALIFMGISFAFKLQATFFLPFLIIMWLKGKVKLRHFILIPIPLVISVLPVWFMGRSMSFLLGRYLQQSQAYSSLTVSYPNIYSIFENNEISWQLGSAALFFTVSLFGCLAYYIYTKSFHLNYNIIVLLALFTTAAGVYFLPHMHERYGYIVDLIAIVYGICNIKKLYLLIGYALVSMLSYLPYLFKSTIVPGYYTGFLMLVLIIITGYDLYAQIKKASYSDKTCPLQQR